MQLITLLQSLTLFERVSFISTIQIHRAKYLTWLYSKLKSKIDVCLTISKTIQLVPDGEDGRRWIWQVLQQVAAISIPHLHMKSLFEAATKTSNASDWQALRCVVMNITVLWGIWRAWNTELISQKLVRIINVKYRKMEASIFLSNLLAWLAVQLSKAIVQWSI